MKLYPLAWFCLLVLPLKIAGGETLIYHEIQTDPQGRIVPWFDASPAKSYDHGIGLLWKFWSSMRKDQSGLPYYLNHQVWNAESDDARGVAGDQIQETMSSWRLLYAYGGDEHVKENQRFLADWYLTRGLSPADSKWPNLPYPYNTLLYSGTYDGDMILGKDYAQVDKAGSFGLELLHLYETMHQERYSHPSGQRYLEAAIAIADLLADKMQPGDTNQSPLPFKVNVRTGEPGRLKSNDDGHDTGPSTYSTSWAPTLELWLELIRLRAGRTTEYQHAFDAMLGWMKAYPMVDQKWGPFFEDIPGWSDTQINAVTWVRFILEHRELFPEWKADTERILDWVYRTLGNERWKKYGVVAINEQTVYQTPGNSHTARQGATELLFASLTGDEARRDRAIRQLNWATYMVDFDGKNRYPRDLNWLVDGYSDYIRHYLRAFATDPTLAPPGANHLVSSTTTIQEIAYDGAEKRFLGPPEGTAQDTVVVAYMAFDITGTEVLRLALKPSRVLLGDRLLPEGTGADSFTWRELPEGGILTVKRSTGSHIFVLK